MVNKIIILAFLLSSVFGCATKNLDPDRSPSSSEQGLSKYATSDDVLRFLAGDRGVPDRILLEKLQADDFSTYPIFLTVDGVMSYDQKCMNDRNGKNICHEAYKNTYVFDKPDRNMLMRVDQLIDQLTKSRNREQLRTVGSYLVFYYNQLSKENKQYAFSLFYKVVNSTGYWAEFKMPGTESRAITEYQVNIFAQHGGVRRAFEKMDKGVIGALFADLPNWTYKTDLVTHIKRLDKSNRNTLLSLFYKVARSDGDVDFNETKCAKLSYEPAIDTCEVLMALRK